MNKIEMIDKAIKDLDGDIRNTVNGEVSLYKYLWKNSLGYHIAAEGSIVHNKGEYFCTIEEFEQRKKDLEQMNWYDYENQRAVSKPPIGEIVLHDDYKHGMIKVKILGHHPNNGGVWSEAVGGTFAEGNSYSTDGYYCFRPLDWDKLSAKKKLISEVSKIIFHHICIENAVETLYNDGYLKLPEESK